MNLSSSILGKNLQIHRLHRSQLEFHTSISSRNQSILGLFDRFPPQINGVAVRCSNTWREFSLPFPAIALYLHLLLISSACYAD